MTKTPKSTITVSITLPDAFQIESRGQTLTVNVNDLKSEIWARAAFHGIKQKIGDSASGANNPDNWTDDEKALDNSESGAKNPAAQACTKRVMDAAYDRLVDGDWKAASVAVHDEYGHLRKHIRATMQTNAKIKAFAESREQKTTQKFVDALFDRLNDKDRAVILAEAERRYADESIEICIPDLPDA